MGVDREIRSVRAFARFRAVSRDACGDDMISVVARRVRRIASSLRAREDATTDVPLVPRYRRRDISNTDRLRARTRHDRRGRIGRFGQSTHRGERYFFESRLVVCPPPTHPPSCPPTERNQSFNRRRIDRRARRSHLHRFAPPSSSTSTPWASGPWSSSRRGVARVHPS